MKEGFALKSFLIIIGLSMIIVLAVFLVQEKDVKNSRIESVVELYNRYIENQSIDESEEILEERLAAEIREIGPAAILCMNQIPENTILENVRENEELIDVTLNTLEGFIRITTKENDEGWRIIRIDCPLIEPEEDIEEIEEDPAEELLIETIEETDILPISKAKKDLALRLNINLSEIKIDSAEAVIFSDSTLGTSAPGEVYNQKLTPGYLIILSALEKDYRYHADESQAIFISENF